MLPLLSVFAELLSLSVLDELPSVDELAFSVDDSLVESVLDTSVDDSLLEDNSVVSTITSDKNESIVVICPEMCCKIEQIITVYGANFHIYLFRLRIRC